MALDPIKEPLVFPLRPCCQGNASRSLGCLVTGYFPGPVTVTWDGVSANTSALQFPATSPTSGLQVTTSQVTTSSKLATQKFTCHVVHGPSGTHKNKTLTGCSPSNITRPTLRLLYSACDPNEFHPTIQLHCFVSGYVLEGFGVTWLKNGQKLPLRPPYTAPHMQEGKLFSTHSELNISQEEWAAEDTFTCRVSSQDHFYEAHTRKCTDFEPRGMSAYVTPPSPLDLYVRDTPRLTCVVMDLEKEDGVSVAWSRESGKQVNTSSWKATKHPNATTSITSTLPVSTTDWIEGEAYLCTVTHPDLPRPLLRPIAKAPGQRLPPEVYVFPPPEEKEQKAQKAQGADAGSRSPLTLTCLVQGFSPAELDLQWLRENELIPSNQYSTTAPLKAPSSTYFVFSRLEIPRETWARSDAFTCRVIHEALPKPRTLEKTVSRSPELDLEDLCAEEAEGEDLAGLWTSTYIFITLFLVSVSYGATVTLFKVKWVLSALLQEAPQALHDYANILQPAA